MEGDNDEGSVVISNIYGDVCIRKARRKRQKALVQEIFYDYATNTTLHGLPYTTKRGVSTIEKIFWLITFIASICLCFYLIHNVWIKWITSPVIVTVSEKLVPVRTVPFPSVLICPQSKSKASVYNYTAEKIRLDKILELDDSEIALHEKDFAKFQDVTNVCGHLNIRPLLELTSTSYSGKFMDRLYSNDTLARHIYDVAPKATDIFEKCILWGTQFDCDIFLSETLTAEGLCFTFNSLSAQDIFRSNSLHREIPLLTANQSTVDWTMEKGYSDRGLNVYPLPGKENGAYPDFALIMKDIIADRDPMCNIVYSGFKVYIQHPADLPQSSLYYFAVLNRQVSSMALSFNMLNTSETLRGYSPEIRQCYFSDERYLKYFKIYTANNCKIECLANMTYIMCECVAFYMPHESKRICTVQNTDCMNQARDLVVDFGEGNGIEACNCLPSCNSVDYDAEILKTEYKLKDLIKAHSQQTGNTTGYRKGTRFSKMEMYFKQSRFVSMHRSELFGLTDFLANIGGLLGLFLGFSFLSLVELFYFATLRLWCTLKKDLKEEKLQRKNAVVRKF